MITTKECIEWLEIIKSDMPMQSMVDENKLIYRKYAPWDTYVDAINMIIEFLKQLQVSLH